MNAHVAAAPSTATPAHTYIITATPRCAPPPLGSSSYACKMAGMTAVPSTAPSFPAAAARPKAVAREAVGKSSAGSTKVVVLGPMLANANARPYSRTKGTPYRDVCSWRSPTPRMKYAAAHAAKPYTCSRRRPTRSMAATAPT